MQGKGKLRVGAIRLARRAQSPQQQAAEEKNKEEPIIARVHKRVTHQLRLKPRKSPPRPHRPASRGAERLEAARPQSRPAVASDRCLGRSRTLSMENPAPFPLDRGRARAMSRAKCRMLTMHQGLGHCQHLAHRVSQVQESRPPGCFHRPDPRRQQEGTTNSQRSSPRKALVL